MPSDFDARQRTRWADADPAHRAWRTENPEIARLEDALLTPLARDFAGLSSLLDVGSGEADVLPLLRRAGYQGLYVGVDGSAGQAAFAQQRHRSETERRNAFAAADGMRLPFRDGAFEGVMCRDLLHHVSLPEAALAELVRVASRKVVVVEPNPLAPIIAGFALVRSSERGMLRSLPWRMRAMTSRSAPGWRLRQSFAEPQAASRLLLHYHFGFPKLARLRSVRSGIRAYESLARLSPRWTWNYQVLVLEREATSPGPGPTAQ